MEFPQKKDQYKIWVFAPFLVTDDPNLQFYYDYTQSIEEYKRVFEVLDCEWEWVNITMSNYENEIERVERNKEKKNLVINLCDGDEINEVPGVSVIHALTKHHLAYTGADSYFYEITTSKIIMKKAFDLYQVKTPGWMILDEMPDESKLKEIGEPAILKPAVSAGSMGLSIKNVVSSVEELKAVLQDIQQGYHGWRLHESGLILEQFITGREFTTFITGSTTNPEEIRFYQPAERVFHQSLPDKEQFLSFDRLWETYDNESAMPGEDFFYQYAEVASSELVLALKDISLKAFHAVKGMGYARLDIRMDKASGELYVLEINAQCGLSEDEDYTSIGAILRFSHVTFAQLIAALLEDALRRQKNTD